jgi:DNA-binding MarR family transcriptional regulator
MAYRDPGIIPITQQAPWHHRGFNDLREIDATLLRYLHHAGGATITELARLLHVTKQAMSQHVASFVVRGYGTRERSPQDGRERVVQLTDRGRAARRAAIEFADLVETELIETVGASAVRGFRRALAASSAHD